MSHKPLQNLPVFDASVFASLVVPWKARKSAVPGSDRIVVEWGVQKAASVFVYPAGDRGVGVQLVETRPGQSDERWADFLEYQFVPQVVQATTENGLRPQVICVDLRPIQIQRERRRQLERIAHEKTGGDAHNVYEPGHGKHSGKASLSSTQMNTAQTPHAMETM